MIGQIAEKTGYTHNYILWQRPWISFLIEMADAPRYISGLRPIPEIESTEDLANNLGGNVMIV